MSLYIQHGGAFSTVQDMGRFGYRRYGVPVSGAMDKRSAFLANLLAGNDPGAALIEVTLLGPVIQFEEDVPFSITGADLSPTLNGAPLEMYAGLCGRRGDVLRFGEVKYGCRAYIAFGGGITVSPVMGSRSTYHKAGIGGIHGGKLREGDRLPVGGHRASPKVRSMPREVFAGAVELRVTDGIQKERFTQEGIDRFYRAEYTALSQSDRMGIRLSGEAVAHARGADILSEGVVPGAIQIPPNGQPIIMMADCQTTGGYTKIANVISADLPLAAQISAGDRARFRRVDIAAAQALYREEQKRLAALAGLCADKTMRVTVNGTAFDTAITEIRNV